MSQIRHCDFREVLPGYWRCRRARCGNWYLGECRTKPIECSAGQTVAAPSPVFVRSPRIEEQLPCIHRGEMKGQIKCSCGRQGAERWIDTFACHSADQPRRSCIIAGTIQLEPERSLYAVCAMCQWREPNAQEDVRQQIYDASP